MIKPISPLLVALVLGVVLSPVALAAPPADKGKGQSSAQASGKDPQGGQGQSSHDDGGASKGQGKGKNGDKGKADSDDRYDPYEDKYRGSQEDSNHGQRVSDCNHRANGKQLKGQERKEYVEWCVDNGERYKYDDRRWTDSRNCYQKADDRNLSGDARRSFITTCTKGIFSR